MALRYRIVCRACGKTKDVLGGSGGAIPTTCATCRNASKKAK